MADVFKNDSKMGVKQSLQKLSFEFLRYKAGVVGRIIRLNDETYKWKLCFASSVMMMAMLGVFLIFLR